MKAFLSSTRQTHLKTLKNQVYPTFKPVTFSQTLNFVNTLHPKNTNKNPCLL